MKKILLVSAIILMPVGIGFAQDKTSQTFQGRQPRSLEIRIDPDAEWGRWMMDVFNPYFHQMQQAGAIPEFQRENNRLTAYESTKKYTEYYHKLELERFHGIQRIIPPEDLQKYHDLILKFFTTVMNLPADSQMDFQSRPDIKQVLDQALQELRSVFEQHKVPNNIMSEFCYFRLNVKMEN